MPPRNVNAIEVIQNILLIIKIWIIIDKIFLSNK